MREYRVGANPMISYLMILYQSIVAYPILPYPSLPRLILGYPDVRVESDS